MSSPRPVRFPASRHTTAEIGATQAEDFESMAQLVEDSLPNFEKEEERQFFSKVVQSYREAASRLLRKAWSDDQGQDITEYAVMFATILLTVVVTIRLIGTNASAVFSQGASSIQ
jgi:Flp pilus assembly pilin Flp